MTAPNQSRDSSGRNTRSLRPGPCPSYSTAPDLNGFLLRTIKPPTSIAILRPSASDQKMAASFVANTESKLEGGPAPHPYFPPIAHIPAYVPNDTPVLQVVAIFGAVVVAVVGSALRQTARSKAPLRGIDRVAAAWFALCESFMLSYCFVLGEEYRG